MNLAFTPLVTSLETKGAADILKYAGDPNVIPLSAGSPAKEAFPTAQLGEITGRILRDEPLTALQYGPTEGYGPLREHLTIWLKAAYGIGGPGDRVLVTAGAQQVMWLAALCLCGEGDVILCEDPSFIGSLNAFRGSRAQLVGIPMEADGLDADALEQALATHKNVKLLYTITSFQNPTGVTMSLEKRKRVYALAKQHGILILEDNPYGDLRYSGEHLPTLKSMDTEGIVIYAGSFSKVIAPGLRVGYAVADAALIQAMGQVKLCDDVHTAALSQMICHRFLTEYDFDAHLNSLRALYAKKCDFAKDCFTRHLAPYGITCAPTEGGLFLWLTLPEAVDMRAFCTAAVEEYGVGVVPGTTFAVNPQGLSHGFRINFSAPTAEAIQEGFQRLGRCAETHIN